MTEASAGSGGNVANPDLEAMHRDLVALAGRLERSIDNAPTAAAIGAITDQIVEVNARVTATGRVLLARQTEEIARHARAVSAAIPAIEEEIADPERCERLVRSITSMLGTVDDAVRMATLV
jgi:hypothetical protein